MATYTWKTLGICTLVLMLLGSASVTSDVRAQSLPSWAEFQESRRAATDRSRTRTERREREHSRDTRSSARRGRSLRASRGEFRTRAPGGGQGPPQECSTSQDCSGYPNEYCGTNGKCFSNGSGPGNQNGGGQQPSDVPIGGAWAPFWNVTMIVLGVGLGVYHLNRRGRTLPISWLEAARKNACGSITGDIHEQLRESRTPRGCVARPLDGIGDVAALVIEPSSELATTRGNGKHPYEAGEVVRQFRVRADLT